MQPLGIIPELELDCLPRPGEVIVACVDHGARTLGTSDYLGGPVTRRGPWEAFPHRYSGPWAPRDSHPGDLVVPC